MKNKKSFLLYNDTLDIESKLSDEQLGQLFRAIIRYQKKETIDMEFGVELLFHSFKKQFDRDFEKYNEVCNRNSMNGKSGGRPKKPKETHNNPKKPTGFSNNPKKADKDTDTDKDTDKDNKNTLTAKAEELELVFDSFRKKYPGTKKGLLTEFNNFKKKHKDYKTIVHSLSESLDAQIAARDKLKGFGQFVPEWKHLTTWINGRCWEEELPEAEEVEKTDQDLVREYEAIGYNKFREKYGQAEAYRVDDLI